MMNKKLCRYFGIYQISFEQTQQIKYMKIVFKFRFQITKNNLKLIGLLTNSVIPILWKV